MKLYEVIDCNSGLGFAKFDNLNGYVPVWKKKAKQYKSYSSVQEVLDELLRIHHIKSAFIRETTLDKVGEWDYNLSETAMNGVDSASKFVLYDSKAKKYFCTRTGFSTTLFGANFFDSPSKAKDSVQRKINAIKAQISNGRDLRSSPDLFFSGLGAIFAAQHVDELYQLKDSSNWVVIGFSEKQTFLPQSVAKSGVDMDWY